MPLASKHRMIDAMTDIELIADTNRLLQQLVDFQTRQEAESKRAKEEMDARMAEMETKRKENTRRLMEGLGVQTHDAALSETDLDEKMASVREEGKRRIEEVRQIESTFRDQLLAELRAQSELLRQIFERLGR